MENLTKKQAEMKAWWERKQARIYASKEENKEIVASLKSNPDLSYKAIGQLVGRTGGAVAGIAKRNGLQHGRTGRRRFTSGKRVTSIPTDPLKVKNKVVAKRTIQQCNEDKIIAYVQAHPEMTYREIAEVFGLQSTNAVGNLVYRRGVKRIKYGEEADAAKKQLVQYVINNPDKSYSDIGRELNLPTMHVGRVAREYGIIRGKGHGPRCNAGRGGYSLTEEQREHLSVMMTELWASVPDTHRKRLSRIMREHWNNARKNQFSSAMKKMWKDVNPSQKMIL